MSPVSIDQQIQILSRRCEKIVPESELRAKLERAARSGKPLRVKLGMDPTAPDVTLGHAVPLSVVRQLQDWGHQAVIIVGDYTARVGDPSGRNATRPVLTDHEIDTNAATYVAQIGKILRTDPPYLEVRFNSEWLGKMGMVEIIRLASRKSVAQLLAREDFAKRFAEGVDIRLHELMYPLLQGWDSVMIQADIELGGSDQLFNNLVGREFQKEERPEDPLAGQVVIVTPLLVGTDGSAKMSKSKGNYIGVTESPSEMFGKVMSLPDAAMRSYYTLLTDERPEQFEPLIRDAPRDAKVRLAKKIIARLHSPDDADRAEANFDRVFRQRGVPDDMPEVTVRKGPHRLAPLVVVAGLASSNGEALRKLREGAISLDGSRLTDEKAPVVIDRPAVLKLGRRFVRLKPDA